MNILILIVLFIPILFWIAFIIAMFDEAVKKVNEDISITFLMLATGILMSYGLYEFLLKIIYLK